MPRATLEPYLNPGEQRSYNQSTGLDLNRALRLIVLQTMAQIYALSLCKKSSEGAGLCLVPSITHSDEMCNRKEERGSGMRKSEAVQSPEMLQTSSSISASIIAKSE